VTQDHLERGSGARNLDKTELHGVKWSVVHAALGSARHNGVSHKLSSTHSLTATFYGVTYLLSVEGNVQANTRRRAGVSSQRRTHIEVSRRPVACSHRTAVSAM